MAASKWSEVQKDFSGGEIGAPLIMRDDSDFHSKAVLEMENIMPTLQGTAVRVPGTQFVLDTESADVRLIPYLTPTNDRALVIIKEGSIRIISNLTTITSRNVVSMNTGPVEIKALTPVVLQIAENPLFEQGLSGWEIDPVKYLGQEQANLGCWYSQGNGGFVNMVSRIWQDPTERADANVFGTATIPASGDGLWLKFRVRLQYFNNGTSPDAEYQATIRVGTAKGLGDLWEREVTGRPAGIIEYLKTITNLSLAPEQVIYLSVTTLAIRGPGGGASDPHFNLFNFEVYTQGIIDINDDVVGSTPWQEEDLPDIQYVQSPYPDEDDVDSTGKELVFTHPKYPPFELVVIAGVFTVRQKAFNDVPTVWAGNNYPAACTSFNGRLLLGGSQTNPIPGDPVGSAVETVWGTAVGDWNELISTTGAGGVLASDSIEFTAIYRSPIQWLFGQKQLLVGAREMEYIASADGIFQPSDIGVDMQSTHGSIGVQPVGLGHSVVFASEGGTKVRSMLFQNEDAGFISPDLTLLHPSLFSSGIKRMVRMRNPHQMVVVVMNTGQLAILHLDNYAGIQGWSRVNLNANIKDAAVLVDDEGLDVLYLTVQRVVEGETVLYIESMDNWVDGRAWDYVQSSIVAIPDEPTNIINGLDHLEGMFVQVIADGSYIGTRRVLNGSITLLDDTGEPIIFTAARTGLQMDCRMVTLPIIGADPGSEKRYTEITVRTINSARPIINGERPADRDPASLQNISQTVDIFRDNRVANLGTDRVQVVTIEENTPVRLEVIGIFGIVRSSNL